jgi:DNA-binding IclR family transcriptional regulator
MSTNEPYPGTQAVSRALTLLKSFTDEQPERSLVELAQGANLNKTTTYRLMTALESEGLVVRTGQTDAYRLGSEMIVLGGRAMRSNSLRVISRPEIEALAQQTRETATVEVLFAGQVLILDEVSGSYLIGAAHEVGGQWPLHVTSTGKVFLAYLPQAERELLLQFPLTSFTPHTITAAADLQQELSDIRERGYAIANEELEVGFVAIGAPVRNHNGQIVAAISIGGPSTRLPQAEMAESADLVQQAAGRISAKLGYR